MKLSAFAPIAADIKQIQGRTCIKDPIRRRYVVLTPEEWVRQHLIHHLIHHKHWPAGLMTVENAVQKSTVLKRGRYDLLVYSSTGSPLLLAECKRPESPLDDALMMQALAYNQRLQARYIVLTNGMACVCFDTLLGQHWEADVPDYEAL